MTCTAHSSTSNAKWPDVLSISSETSCDCFSEEEVRPTSEFLQSSNQTACSITACRKRQAKQAGVQLLQQLLCLIANLFIMLPLPDAPSMPRIVLPQLQQEMLHTRCEEEVRPTSEFLQYYWLPRLAKNETATPLSVS